MSHFTMTDDKTLVAQILGGDRQGYLLLIKTHERLVAHMVSRLVKNHEEREELCQDVFLKVFDKLGDFNFQSRLSTWIATIAYRQAINHLRKKKMFFTALPEGDAFESSHFQSDDPGAEAEERDMDDLISRAMEKLPPAYRTVLTLYHAEGLSYAEIGEITGMPEGTVKNYIFRGRKLLKDKVKKFLGKEELL